MDSQGSETRHDCTEFPWPQIRATLGDLLQIVQRSGDNLPQVVR